MPSFKDAADLEASVGMSRLSTHEAICAERYSNILASIEGMTLRVGKLEMLVWLCAGSLIAGMAALIVTLALAKLHP